MKVLSLLIVLMVIAYPHSVRADFNGYLGDYSYSLNITSVKERRFQTVYQQKYDFSCGSAALASLLTFHYDDTVDELDVFEDMFKNGEQQKIQAQGFSLLDMKQYLKRRGYTANGYKISLEQLEAAKVPAITIIDAQGYKHFVIVKGSNSEEVLVGDPAAGVKVYPREEFKDIWANRIIFVIQNKKDIASAHYESLEDWNLRVKARLGMAIDHSSLALFNMLQPSNTDF